MVLLCLCLLQWFPRWQNLSHQNKKLFLLMDFWIGIVFLLLDLPTYATSSLSPLLTLHFPNYPPFPCFLPSISSITLHLPASYPQFPQLPSICPLLTLNIPNYPPFARFLPSICPLTLPLPSICPLAQPIASPRFYPSVINFKVGLIR
jgi:hypothetical protein